MSQGLERNIQESGDSLECHKQIILLIISLFYCSLSLIIIIIIESLYVNSDFTSQEDISSRLYSISH